MSVNELLPLLPAGVLVVFGLLLLLYEVFSNQSEQRRYSAHLAVLGFAIALTVVAFQLRDPTASLFLGPGGLASLVVDAFARVAFILLMVAGLVACLLSPGYAKNAGHSLGEYYGLLMFSVAGMMIMVSAADLATFFVGLETMSVAVYALTALRRRDVRSTEAALKYFLMGAFATAFFLFGLALVFGTVGSLHLTHLAEAMSTGTTLLREPLLHVGLLLILVGFAFKVAAFPFHMWAPDAYEGAPTPVTGFMAVAVKTAAFVSLLRLIVVGFDGAMSSQTGGASWTVLLEALSISTILVGNALALTQRSIKRMLAYSSVAHSGYVFIGLTAVAEGEASAGAGILFYLAAYTAMTLGAFGVLAYLERREGGSEAERFGAYAGIGFRHPAASALMALFVVSLAGLPPTGGFFGKLFVFSAALRAGHTGLVLIGVLGSVIGVYYYLRVIVAFYMRDVPEPGPTPSATPSAELGFGLLIAAILVVVLGVVPGPLIELGRAAIASLG
ncbi:MAG: NADH-quinone oxidoreductase subunit N [Deltaproteobacteria bacterium]|nr:NADH-quinone oxidoreductase subunit N [Deltaproteobacteria bacterium]